VKEIVRLHGICYGPNMCLPHMEFSWNMAIDWIWFQTTSSNQFVASTIVEKGRFIIMFSLHISLQILMIPFQEGDEEEEDMPSNVILPKCSILILLGLHMNNLSLRFVESLSSILYNWKRTGPHTGNMLNDYNEVYKNNDISHLLLSSTFDKQIEGNIIE
ncbi:hypothetical protein ACJX0J_025150, partial [Zea mays]